MFLFKCFQKLEKVLSFPIFDVLYIIPIYKTFFCEPRQTQYLLQYGTRNIKYFQRVRSFIALGNRLLLALYLHRKSVSKLCMIELFTEQAPLPVL